MIPRPPIKRRSFVEIDGVKIARVDAVEQYKGTLCKATLFARLKTRPVCTSAWLTRRIANAVTVTIDGEQMGITDAIKRYKTATLSEQALRSRLMRKRVCTTQELTRKSRSWVYRRIVDESDAWTLNGKRMPSGHACKWLARISSQGKVRVYKDGTDIRTRPDDGSEPDGYEAIICGATADEIRDMLT